MLHLTEIKKMREGAAIARDSSRPVVIADEHDEMDIEG